MCHLVDVVVGTSSQFDALFFSDTHFFFYCFVCCDPGWGSNDNDVFLFTRWVVFFVFVFVCVELFSTVLH